MGPWITLNYYLILHDAWFSPGTNRPCTCSADALSICHPLSSVVLSTHVTGHHRRWIGFIYPAASFLSAAEMRATTLWESNYRQCPGRRYTEETDRTTVAVKESLVGAEGRSQTNVSVLGSQPSCSIIYRHWLNNPACFETSQEVPRTRSN